MHTKYMYIKNCFKTPYLKYIIGCDWIYHQAVPFVLPHARAEQECAHHLQDHPGKMDFLSPEQMPQKQKRPRACPYLPSREIGANDRPGVNGHNPNKACVFHR